MELDYKKIYEAAEAYRRALDAAEYADADSKAFVFKKMLAENELLSGYLLSVRMPSLGSMMQAPPEIVLTAFAASEHLAKDIPEEQAHEEIQKEVDKFQKFAAKQAVNNFNKSMGGNSEGTENVPEPGL